MQVGHPVRAVDAGQHVHVTFLGVDWTLSDRRRLMPVRHPVSAVHASQHLHVTFLGNVTHRQCFT